MTISKDFYNFIINKNNSPKAQDRQFFVASVEN